MKHRLVCASLSSESAKLLSQALTDTGTYRVFRSRLPRAGRNNIIYGDQRDKLTQYKYFLENKLNFPRFTESKEEALDMCMNTPVVCRTLLRARAGKGIVIADTPEQIVDAPVYVAYHKKTAEYRVNLYRGEVVCIREKRLRKGYERPEGQDYRVRSHDNGYVFCEPLVPVSHEAIAMCIKASAITNSDIVGIDLAYHKPTNYYFLLEVNSAPGMQGDTIDRYVKAIINKE